MILDHPYSMTRNQNVQAADDTREATVSGGFSFTEDPLEDVDDLVNYS
jgi:hypothetical protein